MKNIKNEVRNADKMLTYDKIPLAELSQLRKHLIEGLFYKGENLIDMSIIDREKFIKLAKDKGYIDKINGKKSLVVPSHRWLDILDFEKTTGMILFKNRFFSDLEFEIHIDFFEESYIEIEFN